MQPAPSENTELAPQVASPLASVAAPETSRTGNHRRKPKEQLTESGVKSADRHARIWNALECEIFPTLVQCCLENDDPRLLHILEQMRTKVFFKKTTQVEGETMKLAEQLLRQQRRISAGGTPEATNEPGGRVSSGALDMTETGAVFAKRSASRGPNTLVENLDRRGSDLRSRAVSCRSPL